MYNIILQIKGDTVNLLTTKNIENNLFSIWFWLSIFEFIFIIYLIVRLKAKKTNLAFADVDKSRIYNTKSETINMENLMNSINGAKSLYKELSSKCHPDRFVNSPNQKNAEEIFQEITKNKRNFEKLSALKTRAEKQLNINFK